MVRTIYNYYSSKNTTCFATVSTPGYGGSYNRLKEFYSEIGCWGRVRGWGEDFFLSLLPPCIRFLMFVSEVLSFVFEKSQTDLAT